MSDRRRRAFRLPSDSDRLEDELDEEVRFHIERRVERLMAEGMSEQDARSEARRRFGSVDRVKHRMRRQGEVGMNAAIWDGLRQDVHYAVRQLVKNPGFTAVTVATLALGIGATTSIFSVVDAVLFRPLPFPEPNELVAVWADITRKGGPADEWTNFADFFDLQERSRTLEAVGAWDGGTSTLTGLGEPEPISVGSVTHGMLSEVLSVEPALGRGFAPEDDLPGAPATVILSDGFWRRALGARPGVIGETLTLNEEVHTIIGVLPEGFEAPFAGGAELWATLRQSATDNFCGRGSACLRVVARMADGVSLEAVRAEGSDIAAQLEREHPEANAMVGMTILPLQEDLVQGARAPLLLLLSAVGFVLLIACVNVANLLLARSTARGAELAVRSAMGAGRHRLTAQLLTESALLALVGGAAGLAIAFGGTDLLVALAPPGTPRIDDVAVDARVLGFALGVTALAGLLFGVVPSLRSTRGDLEANLREGGRSGARGVGGMRARGALVSGQVALALVLLVGAGLLVQSFRNLRAEDLGFRTDGVLTLRVNLPGTRYADAVGRRAFVTGLEERLQALPGVERVGTTSWLPLTGFGSDITFYVEGRPLPQPGQENAVWFRRITPAYPETMGFRLLSGRWITEADDESAPPVVVINDGLASRFFPNEDPVGKRLALGNPNEPQWREIVGVAAEARYFGIRGDSRDGLYLPYRQATTPTLFLAVRSTREPTALAAEIRTTVASADPQLAVSSVQTMESIVGDALGPDRFVTMLIGLFAVVALVLAVVGLYGVVSYGVSQRLREMGVRLALGAEGGQVRGLVLRQSLALVGVGIAIGVAGGLAATRLMGSLLFGVSPTDPWTYAGVSLVLAAVATAATAIPARRAARVDPIRVLKAE